MNSNEKPAKMLTESRFTYRPIPIVARFQFTGRKCLYKVYLFLWLCDLARGLRWSTRPGLELPYSNGLSIAVL